MNIVLSVAGAPVQLSGVSRHASNVVRCLLTSPEVSSVHLLAADWQSEALRTAVQSDDPRFHLHLFSIGTSPLSRNRWYYFQLPVIAARRQADIVHLAFPMPLRRSAFRCPTVVSLHDLYPYDISANFGFPKVLFNRMVLRQCLRAADAIACVSEGTRQRLGSLAPQLASKKATTIRNCVEASKATRVPSSMPHWSGEPILLCVAQHRRNKNVLLALRIFQQLLRDMQIDRRTRLVIIGIPGPETPHIHRFIKTSGLMNRVVLLHGISDPELQWFYRNAQLLLAPSIVEGFGLPVAEALLAGCRVVCSDIPTFRELSEDACQYVPLGPSAEQAFAQAVCMSLKEREKTPVALPQLSREVIAKQYVRLYRILLASGPYPRSPRNHYAHETTGPKNEGV